MKKLYIIAFVLMSICISAQDTNKNYTKKITYKVPTSTPVTSYSVEEVNTEVVYYDGLGRPIQQIAHKQSNSGKDVITHIEYDVFGRQIKEFLPYVSSGASLSYIPSSQSDVYNFYANPDFATTGNPNFEATSNPYSQKELENSPSGIVNKQAAPGNDWVMGNGKEIKFEYSTNIENEVRLIKANSVWNQTYELYETSPLISNYYAPNQLYKTITKDENWVSGKNNTTEEFKDKSGKVILKRTYNNGVAHDTYYVYDQFGNLSFVLPPLSDKSLLQSDLDNLCYQYKYDHRNRLVEKKLPGKQWEYIVYNSQDMPVATGPAYNPWGANNETDTGWLITKYDALNRVIYTGWYTGYEVNASKRQKYQVDQNNLTSPYEVVFDNNTIDNITINYTNNVLPTTSFKILTINYYDDYSYPDAPSVPTSLPNSDFSVASSVKGLPTGSWIRVLDDPNNNAYETSFTLYDNKFRPIRNHTTNHLGGYTQVDTNLDWAGKTMYTITKHKRANSNSELVVKDMFEYSAQDKLVLHKQQINQLPEQLITQNTYDELGQLISKNVGGEDITGTSGLQKVDYSYNIRGWLKSINDVTDIQTENDLFAFKINYNDYQELGDNDSSPTLLYNGNISSTYWITGNDNVLRKYNYTYDNLNRLSEAKYKKPQVGSTPDNYHESMTYDMNGNIQTLVRYGDMDTDGYQTEQKIDDLVYSYHPQNKNQLMKVFDSSAFSQGFKDDSDGIEDTDDDYEYDENGNMVSDSNKGITKITYNHLNLPVEIIFGLEGRIAYLYDASGKKLSKQVQNFVTSEDNITEYMAGGFQYKDTALQFFPHAEGYVNASVIEVTCLTCRPASITYTTSYDYVFNYTDHLGNIRLSYTVDPIYGDLKVLEENHYYPFGLKHTNYNSDVLLYSKNEIGSKALKGMPPVVVEPSYNYKYNGKEFEDELGKNTYAYGWRDYDPAIGRFNKMDRFSEKYHKLTPYGYAGNNPVLINDIQGDSLWISFGKNERVLYQNGSVLSRGSDGKFSDYKGEYAKLDKEGNVKGYKGFLGDSVDALNKLSSESNFANGIIETLQESGNNFDIKEGLASFRSDLKDHEGRKGVLNNNGYAFQVLEQGQNLVDYAPFNQIGAGGDIFWNPTKGDNFITLAHEMGHAFDADMGMLDSRRVEFNGGFEEIREIRAVYYENRVRQDMGKSLLKNYNGGPKLLNSSGQPMFIQPPSIILFGL